MKFGSSFPTTLLVLGGWVVQASISSSPETVTPRQLQAATTVDLFEPLTCNSQMAACVPWTQYLKSESHSFSTLIKIGCGVCVTMDLPGPRIDFHQGLDIVGKLVIPERDTRLVIYSTMIVVQGELQVTATGEVGPEPNIHFIMNGDQKDATFQPVWNNAGACGGGPCSVGPKAVVVAGGTVTMRGSPQDTPTWLKIYDVATGGTAAPVVDPSAIAQYRVPPFGCNLDGILADMGTNRGGEDIFLGSLGSSWQRSTDGSLVVNQRNSYYQGPTIDLKNVHSCLREDRTYIVSARVKLLGGPLGYTSCSRTGSGCLALSFDYLDSKSVLRRSDKWRELPSFLEPNGEYFNIAAEFTLTEKEVSSSNLFSNLRLYGPESGMTIEVAEFTFREPPRSAYASVNSICANLVPGNADAESVGHSPFPFQSNSGYVNVVVAREVASQYYGGGVNSFFQVRNRDYASFSTAKNWQGSGLYWTIPTDCLVRDTVFQ